MTNQQAERIANRDEYIVAADSFSVLPAQMHWSPKLILEHRGKAGRNGRPGKVRLGGRTTSSGKIAAVNRIGKDADKSFIQLLRLVRWDKDDTSVGNGRSSFRPRKRDDRQPAGDGRDGAAPAG